jgi:lipid-binding SYLF domain-containing protein
LLTNAQGIVLVPGILKGGFVIGVERGHGVVCIRDANGAWQLPQFVTITGGSIGWQAGVQKTDLVLVFQTKKSVEGLLTGKFTIGVDAAAAAGPIGREASAATDGKLQAEIYSYSRSRGLFAGFSFDGAKIDLDRNATASYYRPTVAIPPGQAVPIPASALRLMQTLQVYASTTAAPVAMVANQPAAAPATTSVVVAPNTGELRSQLAASSQRLAAIVDEQWRGYLAMPAEVYAGDALPQRDALVQTLGRYQSLAAHPQYAALTSRLEFNQTLGLLQQLVATMPAPAIALPPPPQ